MGFKDFSVFNIIKMETFKELYYLYSTPINYKWDFKILVSVFNIITTESFAI